ncbi:MAG: hypothetical protein ACR2H1_05310, partial [Limisphaerales bacterium]
IGVVLNNTWQWDWDNIAFDVSLKAVPAAVSARFQSIRYQSGGVDLQISAPIGSSLRVESRDSLTAPWQAMQTLDNISTSSIWIFDFGQNGRTAPSASSQRFYRIVSF